MRWLCLVLAGCSAKYGELVSAVDVVPTTAPLPNGYTLGPWVSAEGCDWLNEEREFHVGDLMAEAIGSYNALINVTIERYIAVRIDPGLLRTSSRHPHCWRISGQAVSF